MPRVRAVSAAFLPSRDAIATTVVSAPAWIAGTILPSAKRDAPRMPKRNT